MNEECSPNLNTFQRSIGTSMSCSRSTLRCYNASQEIAMYLPYNHIERCVGTFIEKNFDWF